MIFGERLRQARKKASLTQEQLAELAGVKKATVSSLELGLSKNPAAANLHPLARALDIDPEWLITGKGEPRPAETREPSTPYGSLSPAEAAMLQKYRRMTPEQQQAMQTMGDAITQPIKKQANSN